MATQADLQLIPQKNAISTEQIKQIVGLFNSKPFNENLTLVALDELNTFQLGDLLSNIFKYLDPERVINSKETQKEEIIFKVREFLKVLLYQSGYDAQWENGLINGDRKVIYPIFYYLLVNLEAHKKRAYLAKYLVPLDIPQENSGDPEIKKLNEQYKELQAEFQVTHENFETINKGSLNPAELKKDIQQLEQEREQLTTKIGSMKGKHANKPEFAALFEATNLLRREQEEESRLLDKIQSQRQQLENAEAQLMSLEQTLADNKKSLAPSNTPEQMLQATKNEVKKNRELVKERMTFEYNERMRKLQNTERMLSEPPITQNELLMLEQQMMNMRRAVSQMEEKLSKDNTQGDKLAIFKSQAAVVTKKKDQAFEALKREEEELEGLSNEIRKKEEQVHKLKGTGMAKNQLEGYINEIKEKKVKYTRSKAELEEIRWQISNLRRTEQLLRQEKAKYEKAYGMIEGAVKPEANLANASMQDITKQIEKLMEQIKRKKNQLAPKLDEKKTLQTQFEQVERDYKAKKQTFDGTINKIEDEMKDLDTRVSKLKDEVYSMDTKTNIFRFKSEILEAKFTRLNEQADNLHGKGKGVFGVKSFNEYYGAKIKEREKEIADLAVQRQKVSDNHQPSREQTTMFNDLKRLLQTKLNADRSGDHSMMKKGEKHGTNVNVLQLG